MPLASRYLPNGGYWAIVVAALAVACLLQWGLDRATGVKVGPRPLRVLRDGIFYDRPGRPALIAMLVVSLAATVTEASLIRRGLLAAAIVVAALAVAAEVACQRARLRGSARTCETAERRRDRQAGPAHSPDHPVSICGLLAAGADWSSSPRCVMRPGSAARCCRAVPRARRRRVRAKSARARSRRRPRTWFRLTAEGRQALTDHLAWLAQLEEAVSASTRDAQQARPLPGDRDQARAAYPALLGQHLSWF